MQTAAIVLCGGKSSRMGRDKASLPFGAETLLARVVRLVAEVVPRIVVVAAPDQIVPATRHPIEIVRDASPGNGPLEGLRAGLTQLGPACDAAYATSCDVPLIKPALIRELFSRLGQHEIVVPREEKFFHPLAAVYRTTVLDRVEALLAAGQMRPMFLFERCDTLEVPVEELRAWDADLDTFRNLNRPEDYFAALKTAGLTPTSEIIEALGSSQSEA